jgi:hypothetical protein
MTKNIPILILLIATISICSWILYNQESSTGIDHEKQLRVEDISNQNMGKNVKRKIGYAITITKDGPFLDGAIVLGYSALKNQATSTKYSGELIAFVTAGVQKARPILEYHGWKIIEKGLPVGLDEIENINYVNKV